VRSLLTELATPNHHSIETLTPLITRRPAAMTTVAGVHSFGPNHTETTTENVGELALLAVEPGLGGEPGDFTEFERYAAAHDIATAIRNGLAMLTARERLVLAAALLPEFKAPDQP
jgi:hypothetical protein